MQIEIDVDESDIDLNKKWSEIDLNECDHFLKAKWDRLKRVWTLRKAKWNSEIDLNECEHFLRVGH